MVRKARRSRCTDHELLHFNRAPPSFEVMKHEEISDPHIHYIRKRGTTIKQHMKVLPYCYLLWNHVVIKVQDQQALQTYFLADHDCIALLVHNEGWCCQFSNIAAAPTTHLRACLERSSCRTCYELHAMHDGDTMFPVNVDDVDSSSIPPVAYVSRTLEHLQIFEMCRLCDTQNLKYVIIQQSVLCCLLALMMGQSSVLKGVETWMRWIGATL